MRQIIAMGGGGFSMEPDNLALDRFVLAQAPKTNPKICCLALACLGYLKGSFCPHYDSEPKRRPSYQEMIRNGMLNSGLAADDGAAVHFIDDQLAHQVSSRPNAKVYRVQRSPEGIQEEALDTWFLG